MHSPGVVPESPVNKHQGNRNINLFQDPLKSDTSQSTLHLLKPCTYEVIKEEPYVQIVFLNAFIKFKREKRLL